MTRPNGILVAAPAGIIPVLDDAAADSIESAGSGLEGLARR